MFRHLSRRTTTVRLFILLTLALPFVMPAAAFAQEEPGNGAGAAIALSIIALVLLLVAIVAIIGAVSLGLIGLGYAMSNGDE